MTTKETTLKNNGTGKAKSTDNHYFNIRILASDRDSYNRVIWYLKETAIRTEIKEGDILGGKMDYILDKEEKQIARTNTSRRIIELTKEVKEEVKSKIEKIIAGY